MSDISAISRTAVRAVQNDPPDKKLTQCRKVIVALEDNPPAETSERILEDLRRTLRTVQRATDASASPEEITLAGDLLLRVKALGLRREKYRDAKNAGEIFEEAPTKESIVAGVSASQVPRSATPLIDWHLLIELHDEVIHRSKWQGFFDERSDVPLDLRQKLLQNVLGDRPVNVENVRNLHKALRTRNQMGFPVYVVAEEFLRQNGVTLTPDDNTAALNFIADLDAELAK
jgi:hypothetical protein